MHLCPDEINAAMITLGNQGALGYVTTKIRHLWHRIVHGKNVDIQQDGCCHDHEEHADVD